MQEVQVLDPSNRTTAACGEDVNKISVKKRLISYDHNKAARERGTGGGCGGMTQSRLYDQ